MTEQGAQYDHIGSKYDEYARTATLKRAECYTFSRMVGAVDGRRALDLTSGFGFHTQPLKQYGAAEVLKGELRGMCRSAFDNLVEGAGFVAYTVNLAYPLSKPNGRQLRVLLRAPDARGRPLRL